MTDPTAFRAAHAVWFETRMAKLVAEDGWLNLQGRWWLNAGETRSIGTGTQNDIVLETGPEHLGQLTLNADDTARFVPQTGAAVTLDRANGGLSWRADRFLLEITTLNERRALRIRDTQSQAASTLAPIRFFDLDPAWRITARWEALPAPISLKIDTMIGIPTHVPVSHVAKFELGGQEMALLPTYGTPDRPQFVLRDLTSMSETYAHMRFVFGEDVTDTSVVLDFNRAINPPCAFTAHAVCPLPPRENLFEMRIEAGERRLQR